MTADACTEEVSGNQASPSFLLVDAGYREHVSPTSGARFIKDCVGNSFHFDCQLFRLLNLHARY